MVISAHPATGPHGFGATQPAGGGPSAHEERFRGLDGRLWVTEVLSLHEESTGSNIGDESRT